MRTPPLRLRIALTVALSAVVAIGLLDTVVALGVRSHLLRARTDVLATQILTALEAARTAEGPALIDRLEELGIAATLQTPSGRFATPTQPVPPVLARTVDSPAGLLTVAISTAPVDTALRTLLIVQTLASIGTITVVILVTRTVTGRVLRPLTDLADAADRVAGGALHHRIDPDRPDTELGRLAAAIDGMAEALGARIAQEQQRAEAARRLAADAAHQLRTPIAALVATAEAAAAASDPETRGRLLHNLARETQRLRRLIDALLLDARLDTPRPRRVDLEALCRDCIAALPPARSAAVRVTGGATIEADPELLRHAIGNLLDNAVRHARSRVEVSVREADGQVHIVVADDGPGIPQGAEARIFDRFVSLDGAGGAGLGLAIARRIAELHGGTLTCRSRDAGAEFTMTLPRSSGDGS